MQEFTEILGFENEREEYYVDLIEEKGNLFKRFYSKVNNMERVDLEDFIYRITVKENFVINKVYKDRMELTDSKTGKITICIWNNGTVEKYFNQYLGPIHSNNINLINQTDLIHHLQF